MTVDRTENYLIGLVNELRKLPKETEWVEFKHNIVEPEEIGEYISALANSALGVNTKMILCARKEKIALLLR